MQPISTECAIMRVILGEKKTIVESKFLHVLVQGSVVIRLGLHIKMKPWHCLKSGMSEVIFPTIYYVTKQITFSCL